ncbi:MAG: hypothetical protein D6722_20215 [Bacteroidetes bacterium]|nr:MAG: hypothetical protein D6722_20215 [Bacteroidota bacterium]
MAATTIDEVISQLDEIIDWAQAQNSRLGYFPCLYRAVTVAVRDGIDEGRFANGPQMETLDVRFANRYLEAFEDWQAGKNPTRVWQIAFEMSDWHGLSVMQHLMLGMNAHINLDLGIAAAETAPGELLPDLKADFLEINRLLGEMVDEVQDQLGAISPGLRVLDRLGGRVDEGLARLGLRAARSHAWWLARRITSCDLPGQNRCMDRADRRALRIAYLILIPQSYLRRFLFWLNLRREPSPAHIIGVLRGDRS